MPENGGESAVHLSLCQMIHATPWHYLPGDSVKIFVDPHGFAALMACRLIKNRVHPIGICEVVRRIIAKAILSVTRGD